MLSRKQKAKRHGFEIRIKFIQDTTTENFDDGCSHKVYATRKKRSMDGSPFHPLSV